MSVSGEGAGIGDWGRGGLSGLEGGWAGVLLELLESICVLFLTWRQVRRRRVGDDAPSWLGVPD